MIEDKWLEVSLSETDEFERLDGAALFDPTYFNETVADEAATNTDDSQVGSRRQLQTASSDSDSFFIKDFSWAIAVLEKNRMEVQLIFDKPRHISPEI